MNEIEKKALRLLGFAVRARLAAIGVPLVCEALKKPANGAKKRPVIVLEAADTSENTHKRLCDRTAYYGVPHLSLSVDAAALATAVGKRDGAVAAVGVSEPSLAKVITELYQENGRKD